MCMLNCVLIKQKDIKTESELRLNRAELHRFLFYMVKINLYK